MSSWFERLKVALSPKRNQPPHRKLEQGEKTARIKTRFWTNDIVGDEGSKRRELAFRAFVERMVKKQTQDVKPGPRFPFAMTVDANEVLGRELVNRGIALPSGRKMDRYLDQEMKRPPRREDTYDA